SPRRTGEREVASLINVTTSETQPISRDISCISCGYNLRTLSVSAVCPECGTTIEKSLTTDRLDAADPRWLRRVRWGVWLLMAAPLPGVAAGLLTRVTWPWLISTLLSNPVASKLWV